MSSPLLVCLPNMAKPDPKDGHARIPNELIGVLAKVNLSAYEWRIWWAVVRATLSWSRPSAYLSFRELASRAGLDLRHTKRAVSALVRKQMLITSETAGAKTRFALNLDYEIWQDVFKVLPLQATPSVASTGNSKPAENVTREEIAEFLKKIF